VVKGFEESVRKHLISHQVKNFYKSKQTLNIILRNLNIK